MNNEHGGNIFLFSKKLKINPDEILDFSVNLNPLGFPDYISNEIINNINNIYNYPEIRSESLKESIAEIFNLSPNNIVIGNGSTQLIYALPKAFNLSKPVIVNPAFSEYAKSLKIYNIKPVNYKLKEDANFVLNPDKLISFLEKKDFDALFLCNPANPNGFALSDIEVLEAVKFCNKKGKIVILDEAFIDFTDKKSLINKKAKNLIIIKSLTKIFGIAGLRLGYIKTSSRIAQKIEKILEPWSVNFFSYTIGKKLIYDSDFIKKTKKIVEKERNFVVEELSQIKQIKVFPSEANYLLLKINTDKTVDNLEQFLLLKKILIRNCSNYIGLNNKFFRIGIKKRKDNQILIKALKEFFRKE